jgi:hypothetical protein
LNSLTEAWFQRKMESTEVEAFINPLNVSQGDRSEMDADAEEDPSIIST